MERKKYFISILICLMAATTFATNKTKIYNAYIQGDMQQWKNVLTQMELQSEKTNKEIIELVNYQYGYIGWCIGMKKKQEAKKYLKMAENNLNLLAGKNYSPSEINAYTSAFYGFKIGLSPVKAPLLGPKSIKHSKLAMKQDDTNPLGYIQYGNSQFYMPPVFGGSKQEAINHFEKAMSLMESNSIDTTNNWNYLSLLTLIAQSYEVLENFEKAEEYYLKILEIEPDFVFVKDELYPVFLEKINKNE